MLVKQLTGAVAFLLLTIQTISSENKTSREWAEIAQTTISDAKDAFDAASSALSNFNEKKHGDLIKLAKSTGKIAGALGVFSAIFSIVLSFIPEAEDDSEELTYMKSEFGKLTGKVDTIARSLEDTKNLIELTSKKALYAGYEHKIHYGFSQMEECLKKLENVRCSSEMSCKYKKQLVAQSYIKAMNIHQSIDAIVRGVTSNSVFGASMLSLLKQKSKCSIPNINLFANKITALITKGFTVSIFHNMLTKTDHNVLHDTVLANEMLRSVERKRQAIEESCLQDMSYWMSLDVQNSYEIFSSGVQSTNTKVLRRLKVKYPWIHWGVFTYKGKKEPAVGPSTSPFQSFVSSSKEHDVHSFALPIINAEVDNLKEKIKNWKTIAKTIKITDELTTQITSIEKIIKKNTALKNKVQTYAILPGEKWIFGQYKNKLRQHTLGVSEVKSKNVFVHKPVSRKPFISIVAFKLTNYPPKCSATCNNKGKCFNLPYSMVLGCRCNSGYSGDNCQSSDTNLKLKSSINSLLQNTMKLPTFASIQQSIEDTRLYLKSSTENIQDSITKLGIRIEEKIKSLGDFMSEKLDWYTLLLKYKNAIENLHYFHDISNEEFGRSEHSNGTITTAQQTRNVRKDRFKFFQDTDIANYLLSPTGIQKWLYQLNFLIVGRRDSHLNSHKPLILMVMEKFKDKICSTQYKNEITRTYRQLMLLQLQGYTICTNSKIVILKSLSDHIYNVLCLQTNFDTYTLLSSPAPHLS